MTVSIVPTGTAGTRAGDPDYGPEGDYKDGEPAENEITNVLLFFFNENGDAQKVFRKDNDFVSYYEWVPKKEDENGPDHSETVEKQVLTETLNFSTRPSAELPTKMLAVINPPKDLTDRAKALKGLSLSELRKEVADYEGFNETKKTLAESGTFVMTNSVYQDRDNSGNDYIVYTTDCSKGFYQENNKPEDYKPVTIYVERVLARIDLSINMKDYKKIEDPNDPEKVYYIYPTKENYTIGDIKTGTPSDPELEKQLYVRFLGWNVFDTPNKSRLIKEVNSAWDSETLFGKVNEPWSVAAYHRSFWAINPEGMTDNKDNKKDDYRFGPFKENENPDNKDFDDKGWTVVHNSMPVPKGLGSENTKDYVTDYIQENAAPVSALKENPYAAPFIPSKVIIAAQIVDETGKAQTLAQWSDIKSTPDGLLKFFAENLNMWEQGDQKAGEAGNGQLVREYTKIKPEDLTFVESTETNGLTVQLKEDSESKAWYAKEVNGTFTEIEDPQETITDRYGPGTVKVWTNGYAYYYFTIRHLGAHLEAKETAGEFGVVRNHIYDATVKSVAGLGIPVYNPETVIVETDPKDETWMLEAAVKILSWRVVRQDYDLTW